MNTSIFNLDKVLSESAFVGLVANDAINENYLATGNSILKEFNTECLASKDALIKGVLEASDTRKENSASKKYFQEIETAISKSVTKVNEMMSRFVINIDNTIDANKDILENEDLLTNCKPFEFKGYYQYKNIDNPNVPKLEAYAMFKKEFDVLGKLLQDLGASANNTTKLQVIATVYNTMVEKKEDTIPECVQDILGNMTDGDDVASFPEKLYRLFKEKEPVNIVVDKTSLYEFKNHLDNYKELVSIVTLLSSKLVKDFEAIGKDLQNIIAGNDVNSLKIETTTDGVASTTYKLDTYSMQQVDLFVQAKINQVVQIYNTYITALSIRLDVTSDYFTQCKDILTAVKNISDAPVEPAGEEVKEEENVEDNKEPEDSSSDSDDVSESDDSDDEGSEDDTEEKEEEKLPVERDPAPSAESKEATEFEEAVNIFNHDMFKIDYLSEHAHMMDRILSYIKEDGEGEGSSESGDAAAATPGPIDNAADTVGKAKIPMWQVVVNKLVQLWNKFKSLFTRSIDAQVKWLVENEKFIKTPVQEGPDVEGFIEYKLNEIDNIKVVDLNYEAMKENLSSEYNFIASVSEYSKYKDGDFVENIKKTVIGEPKTVTRKDINFEDMYNWCKTYPGIVDSIKKMTDTIDRGRKNAMNISKKMNESVDYGYFSEADFKASDKQGKEDKDKVVKSDAEALRIYFSVTGKVLTAKMSIVQTIFKDYYKSLKWKIQQASKAAKDGGTADEKNNENFN